MDAASDSALVRAVVAGREESFAALVERHLATVYAIASARLRIAADADDVAQETFLNAYRHLGSLREPSKFEAWVAAIARRTAAQHNKRRARDVALSAEYNAPTIEEPRDVSRAEVHRVLHEGVAGLRPIHREVVLLHYFAGKPTNEIAELLGVSQAAVKKRLQRAREALGEDLLNRLSDDEQPKQSLSPLAKTIAAAVAAETVSWTRSGAAVSAAGKLPKLVGFGALAAVGVIVALAVVQARTAPDASPVEPATARVDPPLLEQNPAVDAVDVTQDQIFEASASAADDGVEDAATPVDTIEYAQIVDSSDALDGPLARMVSVAFEDIHIGELLEFVRDTFRLDIYLDARVVPFDDSFEENIWFAREEGKHPASFNSLHDFVTDGMYEEVDMVDLPLSEVLLELLHPLGLDLVLEPGFVWVSTPASIATDVKPFPQERFSGYDEAEMLQTIVSLKFANIHLSEILEFITDTYEVNIHWDHRAVRPEGTPVPAENSKDREASTSLVTDGMVPRINFRDIRTGDALRGILRPLNLAYALTTDGIYVSTPERIAAGDLPLATREIPEGAQHE